MKKKGTERGGVVRLRQPKREVNQTTKSKIASLFFFNNFNPI